MRITKKILLTISIFLLTASLSHAQQKMGFIDLEVIKSTLSDFKSIETKLVQMKKGYDDTLQAMQTEFQQGFESYNKQKALMNADTKAKEEERLTALREKVLRYNEDKFGNSGEMAQAQATLMKPITLKIKNAIETVSKAEKLTVVFEATLTAYYDKKSDITFKVLDVLKKSEK